MAERRMFAKTIIDSDAFLDMPQSTQLLYFHLSMRADDDGFINKPKSIMREVGCKDDDLKILAAKKFLLPFESGVVVIKHWKIHNYIAKDRYTETKYKNELAQLALDENQSYTNCIQDVDTCETQVRLGKVSIGKDRLGKVSKKKERKVFEPPTIEEVQDYCKLNGYNIDYSKYFRHYSKADWHIKTGAKMKDWQDALDKWADREFNQLPPPPQNVMEIKTCPECGKTYYFHQQSCQNTECKTNIVERFV